MYLLVIEKNIRPECFEKFSFGTPTEKERLVNPDAPFAQGQYHAFVCRCAAGGNQGGTDGIISDGIGGLDLVQGFQHWLEGPTAQGSFCRFAFAVCKDVEPVLLVNTLRFVTENNGIAVKRDAQLSALTTGSAAGQYGCRRIAFSQGLADVFRVGRQQQIYAKSGHILVWACAIGESCPLNFEPVMLDRIENPQTRIGAVPGHQDDFDTRVIYFILVQCEQLLDQRKGNARFQVYVLVRDLVFGISFKTLRIIQLVTFAKIK